MRNRVIRREEGQSVVLIAIVFTALLAFLALVFDVGFAYAQRRFMQNAADSAALAGSRELNMVPDKSAQSEQRVLAAIQEFAMRNRVTSSRDVEAYFIRWDDEIGPVRVYIGEREKQIGQNGGIPEEAEGVQVITTHTFGTFFAGAAFERDRATVRAWGDSMCMPPSWAAGVAPVTIRDRTFTPGAPYTLFEPGREAGADRGWLGLDCEYPENGNECSPDASSLKTWMENGYDGPIWVGKSYGGDPGMKESVLDHTAVGAVLIIPVYDHVFHYSKQAPTYCKGQLQDCLSIREMGVVEVYTSDNGYNGKYYFRIVAFTVFRVSRISQHYLEGDFIQYVVPTGGGSGPRARGAVVCKLVPNPNASMPPTPTPWPTEEPTPLGTSTPTATPTQVPTAVGTPTRTPSPTLTPTPNGRLVGHVTAWAPIFITSTNWVSERLPIDVVNVIDISGSMDYGWGGSGDKSYPRKIQSAREALTNFNNLLNPTVGDQVGLVSFPRTVSTSPYSLLCSSGNHNKNYFGQVRNTLTSNIASVNATIASLTPGGGTPLADGIRLGLQTLLDPARHRPENTAALIVASDGIANIRLSGRWTGFAGDVPDSPACNDPAIQEAIDQASAGKAQNVIIFALAMGTDFNPASLQAIASPGRFIQVSTEAELVAAYESLVQITSHLSSTQSCQLASWNGSGATVTISDGQGHVYTTVADANGNYAFNNIVNGTYAVQVSATYTGTVYNILTAGVDAGPTTVSVDIQNNTVTRDLFVTAANPQCTLGSLPMARLPDSPAPATRFAAWQDDQNCQVLEGSYRPLGPGDLFYNLATVTGWLRRLGR